MTTMTRQQRRAEQRRKAKGQDYDTMVSDTLGDLFCFGAYYKGDTDEGFGFSYSEISCPDVDMDIIKKMAQVVESNTKKLLQDIKDGVVTKKTLIEAAWIMLKHNIRKFNLDTYGQETQPDWNKPIGTVDSRLALAVFCDIHFLQEMGEIPVDNQNGMHYGYANF